MATTGMPRLAAVSIMSQIFCECMRPSEPPETVKSCEKAATGRPFTLPMPVTTPSPGIFTWVMPEVS